MGEKHVRLHWLGLGKTSQRSLFLAVAGQRRNVQPVPVVDRRVSLGDADNLVPGLMH